MFTRENFIQQIKHETEVLKHIAQCLPIGSENARLAPNGRTTLELMKYLAIVGTGTAQYIKRGNWDHFGPLNESVADLDRNNFARYLDRQCEQVIKEITEIPESQLLSNTVAMPWGEEVSWGSAFINMTMTFLKTYRLELFLRAKAAGNADIGTSDAWMGMPKPAETEA